MTAADSPRRGTVPTLALIAAMGSMAIHMLVPALPRIASELAIGEARAQQVVSLYLAGLAGGQLVAGPLIDRLGRRPVMLAGLALYIAGAVLAALAPTPAQLLLARLIQASGGACGVVTARVMVGDLFGPAKAAGVQATLMAIVLISPAFAPVIGGTVADIAGWRAIFALLACAGLVGMVAALRGLPETRKATSARTASASLAASYLRLVRNRRFTLTTCALGAASSGLYMFLGAAPFLLTHRFGLAASQAGFALLIVAAASILGTRLVVLAQRHGDGLVYGTISAAVGAAIALILALAGAQSLAAFIAPFLLLGLGAGLAGPVAFNAVAFAEPDLAATATSLAGAMQMLASGTAMALLGLFAPVDPRRLAVALCLSTATALSCALLSRRGKL